MSKNYWVILNEEDNTRMKVVKTAHNKSKKEIFKVIFALFCLFFTTLQTNAQEVAAAIDRDSIKIGEQLNYTVNVILADSTDLVVFPEGQTFAPLEMIDSFKVDTTFAQQKMTLIKRYGLTQFDSGSYTIPRQTISIGQTPFYTDSLRVEVNTVVTDTTKQGLYDIKGIIAVEKASSNWWVWALWILGILALIGAFLFFIIRRSRKKAEAAKKLPPFEQALVSLHQLDEEYKTPGRSTDQTATKAYYSRLTDIVKHYLDEEVYDRSMESTTGELIERLYLEKESGHIDFSTETIKKLEQVLRTADLTKFARITPEAGKSEADRLVVEQVVKETHESIPPPTEEELMRDAEYRDNLERRRKRKLILTGVFGVLGILILSAGILIATKGFDYVKDNFLGHPSKELLEGDWIRSEYGFPPITISTPKVLKRTELPLPDELKGKVEMNAFAYGSYLDDFAVMVNNIRVPGEQEIDLQKSVDGSISGMEQQGAKNLVVKSEKYTTPEGAEGLKTFGTGEFPVEGKPETFRTGEYVMLTFTTPGVIQQVIVVHREDDKYANEMTDRVINSVELQKATN
ncbi:hypothetical protein [Flavimarina sp. Hel_I_48]|uniref:hypothetical protein n=1 Tax=Flavimarina sp. Hel_I_48 TaxID=1392488 RepID=UPI00068B394C|nr:hypothetical protein [Flavimarina sp. Hel_I_48]